MVAMPWRSARARAPFRLPVGAGLLIALVVSLGLWALVLSLLKLA